MRKEIRSGGVAESSVGGVEGSNPKDDATDARRAAVLARAKATLERIAPLIAEIQSAPPAEEFDLQAYLQAFPRRRDGGR